MSAPYQGLGPTLAECLTAEKNALTAELGQVKAERDEAVRRWAAEVNEQTGVIFELRADCAAFKKLLDDVAAVNAEMRAERDTAIRRLEAVLEWSNTERFAGRTRHENDAPSSARSFLDGLDELQTSPKTSKDLDLCDECGCIGLCDPRCSLVPVQQDEPEGVCAFPNCSCTENRCPAKGERGPFCDHGFHPRLCGRCAPVPEAVTDEDEVQCQMCKTVQPRPDKECGHCGAGPKYLCPIHTRPAAAPVQQERSVRAPKTDDPHSLPRVDDLLDDIPVQQEPGRYSDRERVADYLASAQGVEFHDLNDDAQREWLMRASDALRAVWSIGRLVDADDGYEVMCEPVAAMVEEVRAALVPVQQDEPEAWAATENFDPQPGDFLFGSDGQAYMFRKGGWHRYPERDRAATGTTEYSPTVPVQQDEPEADSEFFEKGETGEPPTEEELAFIRESAEDVYESGLPDIEAVPVQQEPERSALGSDEDFRNAVKAYPPLAVSSVGLRDDALIGNDAPWPDLESLREDLGLLVAVTFQQKIGPRVQLAVIRASQAREVLIREEGLLS